MWLAIGLLAFVLAGTYIYLNKMDSELTNGVQEYNLNATEAKVELEKSFETLTPQGEMPEYEKKSEFALLQEVHGMTHQKVQADKKWGSSEITKDKVVKLYEVVENKKFNKTNIQRMLLDILEPWTRGDFSNAVTAHNRIWEYQDGNIGEATRLLTPQEEHAYIEKHFR